jgi:hypothetical protein
MILLPMPEEDDAAGLLTGRGGKLVDGLLGALGLSRTQVYCASALPVHVPMPDWAQLRAEDWARCWPITPRWRPAARAGAGPQRHFNADRTRLAD